MEHLVESHMGGYYISSLDERIIEEVCEQCFDYDRIIVSWENKEEKLKALLNFINNDVIKTPNDLIKFITEDITSDNKEKIKEELKEDIDYYIWQKKQFVEDIYSDKYIDKTTRNILNKQIMDNEMSQIELVDNFDYSQIINQKVKKISYNKKHHN